jgi:hypothetical protein
VTWKILLGARTHRPVETGDAVFHPISIKKAPAGGWGAKGWGFLIFGTTTHPVTANTMIDERIRFPAPAQDDLQREPSENGHVHNVQEIKVLCQRKAVVSFFYESLGDINDQRVGSSHVSSHPGQGRRRDCFIF